MTVERAGDISGLIAAWGNGDEQALGHLVSFVYPELRRIARQHLRCCPAGHTLESAALANEAYLKLIRAGGFWLPLPHAAPSYCVTRRSRSRLNQPTFPSSPLPTRNPWTMRNGWPAITRARCSLAIRKARCWALTPSSLSTDICWRNPTIRLMQRACCVCFPDQLIR